MDLMASATLAWSQRSRPARLRPVTWPPPEWDRSRSKASCPPAPIKTVCVEGRMEILASRSENGPGPPDHLLRFMQHGHPLYVVVSRVQHAGRVVDASVHLDHPGQRVL